MLKVCYEENSRSRVVQLNCGIHCYNLAVKNKLFFHGFGLAIRYSSLEWTCTQKIYLKPSAPDYEKPAAESEQQFDSWILDSVERKKITLCSVIFRGDKTTTVWLWEIESTTSARFLKYFFKCFENSDALRWPFYVLLLNTYSGRGKI